MKKRAKKKAAKKRMRDVILEAIEGSGETVNALAVRSGVKQASLFRFVSNGKDLRLESVQKLCDALGLHLEKDDSI
jgi:hypothetical protein